MNREERGCDHAVGTSFMELGESDSHDPTDLRKNEKTVLTIRTHSGLSGDMFLAGMMRLTDIDVEDLNVLLASLLPDLPGALQLTRRPVRGVGGWMVRIDLPHQHNHRRLAEISALIDESGLSEKAKIRAMATFTLLARAEAIVHDIDPQAVHFHEVGGLDSIIDVCMGCELFCRLDPGVFIVSPLPLADGEIHCAHGILPSPAPAVLELLADVPVRPFAGKGETVTPTALALLRSLDADFGLWPSMRVRRQALVYGERDFAGVPNGAVFAYGPLW